MLERLSFYPIARTTKIQLTLANTKMNDLMPTNIEAEEAVLGGILIDPDAFARIAEVLAPEHFAIDAHRIVYKSARELYLQQKPIDLMTVTTTLTDSNLLDRAGGLTKLAQLVDRTVSAVNIDSYAALIEDKYQRRKLIEAGNNIVQLGHETGTDLETVLDRAEQQIFDITQSRPQQDIVAIGDALSQTFLRLEQLSEGLTAPGIPCGFYDLDVMTGGFQRSDLIIVAARPSMGKCLAASTLIVQSDGSVATIEEIYKKGDCELLTLAKNWRFQSTKSSAFIDDGIKPVFRVTTRLGRSVETTLSHPFLTINGWVPLNQIQVGTEIAIPRKLAVFGTEIVRDCEVKLLAYLIGDGCLTRNAPSFTKGNDRILEDFADAVTEFGGLKLRLQIQTNRTPQYYVTGARTDRKNLVNGKYKNPLRIWLTELGLMGKNAHQKTIPDIVFRLKKQQIVLFLNRLFATDGWATVLATGPAQLGYSSVSEELIRQVQHLLLRFGIIAAIHKRYVKYKETRRPAWQLDITDARAIEQFIVEIGIFGKEPAVLKVKNAIKTKKYHTNRDLIPVEIWKQLAIAKGTESWASLAKRAGIKNCSNIHVNRRALSRDRFLLLADALNDSNLQALGSSDIYWDAIVSVEPLGDTQVYDLTIPETHNFVANDICVHNTSFCTNIAHAIADRQKQPVLFFSLEMSKEQLVQRILSGEAKIESNRLRSGRIEQSEWEHISRAIGELSALPLFIDDTPNITVNEMRSKARRLQAEQGGKLGLVVIDYLQLMEGSSPNNRVQELSQITRSLKGLARELNVPILALSQLSRGVESRNDKRPIMSDLRDSGALEQDSDLVIMLYRDEYYNPDTPDRGIAEVIITKHRNGPTGIIKLLFDAQFTCFRNLASKPA